MGDVYRVVRSDEIYHYGVKGMKWGVRRARRNQKKYSKKYLNKVSKASELTNELSVSKNPSKYKIKKYKKTQDKANKYDRKLSNAIDKEKKLNEKIEEKQIADYFKRLKKMVKKVSKESEKMGGEIHGRKIVNYDHPKFKEANKYLKDSAIEYSKTKEFNRLARQYLNSFDKYGIPKNMQATRDIGNQITDNIKNLAVQKHAKELLALDMKYSGYDINKKNVNDMYEACNKRAPYSVEEIVKESNYNIRSGNKNITNNAVRVAFNEWRKHNRR